MRLFSNMDAHKRINKMEDRLDSVEKSLENDLASLTQITKINAESIKNVSEMLEKQAQASESLLKAWESLVSTVTVIGTLGHFAKWLAGVLVALAGCYAMLVNFGGTF